MEKALVLGASGGMGYSIVKELSSRGISVTAFARTKGKLEKLFGEDPNVTILTGDIFQMEDLRKAAQDVEVIFQSANIPYSEWKERSIPFNTELNPTKATPAFIEIVDKGDCLLLIDKPLFKKFQLKGGKLKGLWIAERKTPEEAFWEFKRSELPVTRKELAQITV